MNIIAVRQLCWIQRKIPPTKRSSPFQEKHAVQYGLEISTRDPETKVVTSVMCRFCRFFGREEKVGQKRKPTSDTKSFMVPFRPALYIQHLEGHHFSKWEEYEALAAAEIESIFKSVVPVVNTLRSHLLELGISCFSKLMHRLWTPLFASCCSTQMRMTRPSRAPS
jgi:hypothetical protein